ncbi:MAG: hypothetical protein ABIT05_15600 [Chitinophagaceae bacterium]
MVKFQRIFITTAVITLHAACGSNNMLKEIKQIDNYPSASGIEYFNKQFFVIGDDANNLLVLDSNLSPVDSIALYAYPGKRIPKPLKADLESILVTNDKKLLLLGSGSLSPNRNSAWLINPATKEKDSIRLDVFYDRLKESGLTELNIEGACSVPGFIVLSNRGNKGYPKNHLIITRAMFWKEQAHCPITVIPLGGNTDSAGFKGVSGLCYTRKTDRLIMTISTEDTHSNTKDGTIGKSYLWIVNDFSSKKNWKAINPNQVIDLDAMDAKFRGQKIESVCITGETRQFLHLVLAADNDNGSSTLFRVIAEKK